MKFDDQIIDPPTDFANVNVYGRSLRLPLNYEPILVE